MRTPDSLATLVGYGVIDDVVRPLMSGKEAQIYLVVSGGKYAVAKIYKEAQNRSFKHRAEYTEGRKVRNTRDQRAIDKRSKHGRQKDEEAWRSTEVDMIHRLHAAGVRVPVPYHFIDGVLVMELITDADGNPAPRLGDVPLDREAALHIYDRLIREVVRMLAAGVVHGDLSEFNVLVGADGPVIIDFPQSVDTAQNMGARRLLVRDVDNLHRFLSRLVPEARRPPYAQEMWHLYEQNLLTGETRLAGNFKQVERKVNTDSVLELIDDASRDERRRRDALGIRGGPREPQARPAIAAGPGAQGRGRDAPKPVGPKPPSLAERRAAPVYQGLANEGLSSWGRRNAGGPNKGHHANRGRAPQARGPSPQQTSPASSTPAKPALHQPDGERSNADRRNAQTGNPNRGHAQHGNPNRGNAGAGNPNHGNAGAGNPNHGNAQPGNPNHGNARGNPNHGNAQPGNPNRGNAGAGNPHRGRQGSPGSTPSREPVIERIHTRPKPAEKAPPQPAPTRESPKPTEAARTEDASAEPRQRRVLRRVTTQTR